VVTGISWQPGAASPKGRTKTWPRGKGLVRAAACHWPANLSGNAARRRDRRDTLRATTLESIAYFEMAGVDG
jgi:hypothetical protein